MIERSELIIPVTPTIGYHVMIYTRDLFTESHEQLKYTIRVAFRMVDSTNVNVSVIPVDVLPRLAADRPEKFYTGYKYLCFLTLPPHTATIEETAKNYTEAMRQAWGLERNQFITIPLTNAVVSAERTNSGVWYI